MLQLILYGSLAVVILRALYIRVIVRNIALLSIVAYDLGLVPLSKSLEVFFVDSRHAPFCNYNISLSSPLVSPPFIDVGVPV